MIGYLKCNPNLTHIIFRLKQEEIGAGSKGEIFNFKTCLTGYNLLTKTVTADLSKHPDCLYRLRVQMMSKKVRALNKDYKALQNKLNTLEDFISKTTYENIKVRAMKNASFEQNVELSTVFHTYDRIFQIQKKVSEPLNNYEKIEMEIMISTIMDTIRDVHKENIQFLALNYGYVSHQPVRGVQYRMNIFTNKELHVARSKHMFGAIQSRILKTPPKKKMPVNILIPLAGRLSNFKRFMKNLEQNILKKQESINVLVAFFPQNTSYTEHKKVFERYNMTYPHSTFTWLNLPGKFARAQALQAAVEFYQDNRLLFFADVDLTFDTNFLQRCRDHTIPGKQVFFPVMFKLFNPKISGFPISSTNLFRSFHRDVGDWALYSFGPVCAYRDDVTSVGGLNVGIKEWGYEDVQLFEAFLSKNVYDVIRVADPGLWHIYHTHTNCDVMTNKIGLIACKLSALSGLAAEGSVVNYLTQKNYTDIF